MERVYDKGAIGKYLVEQLIDWNLRMHAGPIEHSRLAIHLPYRSFSIRTAAYRNGFLHLSSTSLMNYVHTGAESPDQGLPQHRCEIHP